MSKYKPVLCAYCFTWYLNVEELVAQELGGPLICSRCAAPLPKPEKAEQTVGLQFRSGFIAQAAVLVKRLPEAAMPSPVEAARLLFKNDLRSHPLRIGLLVFVWLLCCQRYSTSTAFSFGQIIKTA